MTGFGVSFHKKKKITAATISPEVLKLAKKLELRWPNDEKKSELKWLQESYDYLKDFESRMNEAHFKEKNKSIGATNTAQTRNHRLLWHLTANWSSAYMITAEWAAHVNQMAWSWQGWRGNLKKFTLTEKNNKWVMMKCSAIIAGYSLNGEDFYKIVLPLIKKISIVNKNESTVQSKVNLEYHKRKRGEK